MSPWAPVRHFAMVGEVLEPLPASYVSAATEFETPAFGVSLAHLPPDLDPAQHRVEIWRTGLEPHSQRLERLIHLLAPGELQAVGQMIEPHRSRKVLARAALRIVVSRYLGLTPDAVHFGDGPYGKPALARDMPASALEFNLSTSGGCCLVAVSRNGPVGIDIEAVAPIPHADRLARRFFSAPESVAQQAGDAGDVRTFLRFWTAKEAYVKALGVGLSMSLDDFVVPSEFVFRSAVTFGDRARGRYCLVQVDPGPEMIGTLAVRSPRDHLAVFARDLDLDSELG